VLKVGNRVSKLLTIVYSFPADVFYGGNSPFMSFF
jgi:hypothetical protein